MKLAIKLTMELMSSQKSSCKNMTSRMVLETAIWDGSKKFAETISFIRIEKSPFHNEEETTIVNSSSRSHIKNQTREGKNKQKTHTTMKKSSQSHTCSRTVNSSMYDSDLTTTTSPLTSLAPYSG
jgi:hypothetical protein